MIPRVLRRARRGRCSSRSSSSSSNNVHAPVTATPPPLRPNILDLSKEELHDACEELGLASYRAKQVWGWLYTKGATEFGEMSSLSKAHRSMLAEHFALDGGAPLGAAQIAADGTRKWLSRFRDGRTAESVYIPEASRGTLCVSSQVGCSLACTFCHTGTQPLLRNLSAGEIVGQLLTARRALGDLPLDPKKKRAVSNIVFMGEGEPLYNYRNVLKVRQSLHAPHARRCALLLHS